MSPAQIDDHDPGHPKVQRVRSNELAAVLMTVGSTHNQAD